MMAGRASDVCKINIQLQTESTEGEIGNYGEIMNKKRIKEDEGEKTIWIFFVLCSAMIVAFPGGPAAHVESDPQTSP